MTNSTIIFDFDGTLADSFSVMRKLYNQLAPARGLPELTEEKWQRIRSSKVMDSIKLMGIKPYQLPSLLALGRREILKLAHEIPLFKGMDEIVRTLAKDGHSLYVLSTNSRQVVQAVLETHGIAKEARILKSTPLFGKAQAVRHLMRKQKIPAEEIWMIGDELRDIHAAQKVGVRIISVTWGLQTEETLAAERPDFLAKTPDDILRAVSGR